MSDDIIKDLVEEVVATKARVLKLESWEEELKNMFESMTPRDVKVIAEMYVDQAVGKAQIINDVLLTKLACEKHFNIIREDIETVFEQIQELQNKKFKWRKKYMEFIQKIMDFLGQNPEIIAQAGLKMEEYSVAASQIKAGNPDLNRDGRVTTIEKSIYSIAKMPWQEWMLFLIGLVGAFCGGMYLGSIL